MKLTLTHHAYCLIGSDSVHDELTSLLEKTHKIVARGNPDFTDRKYLNFTIDDARELKSIHETRPVNSNGKKISVLTMNGITVEAQNALLKLLEEPAEYAHFFLIIPSAHLLLPTVKSRLSFIETEKIESAGDLEEAKKFLELSPAKRLETIKSLLDDISKEKKTKQDAINFLNNVEQVVYEKGVAKSRAALEAIENARRYMNDRAPSLKMLLEYLALYV
jgi:DNA polymerase III delta prime subunit